MKLSNVQAQLMFMTLKESCGIHGDIFSLTPDKRSELVNQILNQQGHELHDLSDTSDTNTTSVKSNSPTSTDEFKLVINSTEAGLRLANCYMNASVYVDGGEDGVFDGKLTAIDNDLFDVKIPLIGYLTFSQFIIDLSVNQPCIYKCMDQAVKVSVDFEADNCGNFEYDFNEPYHCIRFIEDSGYHGEVTHIRILNIENMDGVEVEG